MYVEALTRAIDGNEHLGAEQSEVRNIALTGPYGVGKSSVLMEVSRRFQGRSIELSLSSVGREPTESGVQGPAASVTNRIQKEIVKQILYRDAPARTRGSRFRRLSRLSRMRVAVVAVTAATLLMAVLYLTGWSAPLLKAAGKEAAPLVVAYVALWLLAVTAAVLVQWVGYGRWSLEKLTAGPATVTLSGESASYFDQFVDEIVYYFEQTGRNVVIFEDLDRFDDVHIFESLRALNTLLNSAEQVRGRVHRQRRRARGDSTGAEPTGPAGRNPPVVFVYALRDSVFERLEEGGPDGGEDEEARQERRRANRTKFFDLIVPVVPFVSRRNASDLLGDLMAGTPVSDRLIGLAAQHVADQRLLIDLRNEYDVYVDRLLFGEKVLPGLTADKVFAMLLFKAVHLTDFERIRFGSSRLDGLWDNWRELVSIGLDRAAAKERAAQDALGAAGSARRHARVLADRVDELAMALLGAPRDGYQIQAAGGPRYSSDQLRDPEFWRLLVQQQQTLSILYNWNGSETWPFQGLAARLDRPLEATVWRAVDEPSQRRRQQAAAAERAFLTHHSWQQLLERREFTLPSSDGQGSQSFADLVAAVGSPLTRDLIADGFIDEYFGLYVSMFYGRLVSAAALDFMVRALDRGRPDVDHVLDPADVAAILADRGVDVLRDRAAHNISLLDHLLGTRDEAVDVMVRQLAAWTGEDVAFTNRYLQLGARPAALVERLARLREDLTGFLLQVEVDEDRRVALIDAALVAAAPDHEGVDDALRVYVLEHYQQFSSMMEPDAAPTAAEALGRFGVRLPDVSGLNAASLRSLAASGAYLITAGNLAAVSGGDELALDLLVRAPTVRATVMGRLPEYVEVIRAAPEQVSVARAEAFTGVLVEVSDHSANQEVLAELVAEAAPGCQVINLTDAPSAVWAPLLVTGRTPPTARNLLTYLGQVARLEEIAAALERVQELAGGDDLELEDRRLLSVAVLDTRLSPAHRVALVHGLRPGVLTVEEVSAESGPLIGMLLAAGLLADEASTFKQLLPEWDGRESAIAASSAFKSFVDVDVLPGADLAAFFASGLVADPVKQVVAERLPEWADEMDRPGAEAVAGWAVDTDQRLPPSSVETLIAAQASPRPVVVLLSRRDLPVAVLQQLLRQLGGQYARVAGRGTRPLLFPDDAAHRAVLQRLGDAREIGRVKAEPGGLRVWLRRSST